MARPLKQGLDYFPTDCSFYQDIKIRKLIKYNGGVQAVVVYHILLCMIYDKGYYIAWDSDIPFYLDEQTHLGEDYILKVINSAVELGLFDATMYKDQKVLTSSGIQKRYFAAWLNAKRKLSDNLPYLLVCLPSSQIKKNKINSEGNLFSSEETHINSEEIKDKTEETPENSEKSTQRKLKKRKDNLDSLDYPRDAREGERETKVSADVGDLKVCTSIDEEVTNLRNSPIWKEQVFMRFKFLNASDAVLDQYFERWSGECKSKNIEHGTLGEARIHFVNWLIIQEDKLNKNINSYGTNGNNGYRTREDIDAGTLRTLERMSAAAGQPKTELPVV